MHVPAQLDSQGYKGGLIWKQIDVVATHVLCSGST